MKKIVKIAVNGRTYEYDYSTPRIGRKPSEHHPDFQYKEYITSKVKLKNPRILCLQRDNYTCQICGAIDNIDVHHKDNGGYHIKKDKTDNTLSNLITLCHRCHIKLHNGVLGKDKDIFILRKQGYTLQEIADFYMVSRQRIHQILKGLPENFTI